MKFLLRTFLFLLFIPLRLPWTILFSRDYRDKAILYTWQKSTFELENSGNLSKSLSLDKVSFPANGGGMLGRRGRLIIEGSGTGGSSLKREGDHLLAVGGADGRLSLGLLPKKGSGLRIYPIVGVGGSGSGLKVQHDDGSTVLNSGLADVAYHFGIAIDLIIGWRLGLLLGVRIGMESPIASKLMTPFIRFTGGVGWFGHEPKPKSAVSEQAARSVAQNKESADQSKREPQVS